MTDFNYNNFLRENALGPYAKIANSFRSKSHLSLDIFHKEGDDYVMNEDVREKLLQIAQEFINWLGLDVDVEDVTLTGSLSNYNWSEFSDVDLHILIDFSKFREDQDLVKNFFDAKKKVWNNDHNIKIKGFDVEVYAQDTEETHRSSGVYSVLNNGWVIEPEYENPKIDKLSIIRKAKEIEEMIDELAAKYKQGEDITKQTDELKVKINNYRNAGLDRSGEYSEENLVFKMLRRTQYIEKLYNIGKGLADRHLSLDEIF